MGLGGAVAHVVLNGSFTSYVRPVMRVPLALTAAVLLFAGIAGYVSGARGSAEGSADGHAGHGHGRRHHRVSRATLLALIPLAVLVVIRPPALDDAATDRVAPAAARAPDDSGPVAEPLPGDPDTPHAMTFLELSVRATARGGPESLRGRLLSLEGFVAKSQDGAPAGTVRVGRYSIWCCAADATFGAAYVEWPAGAPAPAAGSWYRIVARVSGFTPSLGDPVLTQTTVQAERPPKDQYEF